MFERLKTIDRLILDTIISDAFKSPLKRSRILLHENQENSIQEMLLVVTKDSIVQRHKHPDHKSETYIILEGVLEVEYWESDLADSYKKTYGPLDNADGFPFIVRHLGGIWHAPRSITDYVVYFEIYEGPFRKELDVKYWST